VTPRRVLVRAGDKADSRQALRELPEGKMILVPPPETRTTERPAERGMMANAIAGKELGAVGICYLGFQVGEIQGRLRAIDAGRTGGLLHVEHGASFLGAGVSLPRRGWLLAAPSGVPVLGKTLIPHVP
jgi:hypothetical protein